MYLEPSFLIVCIEPSLFILCIIVAFAEDAIESNIAFHLS